MTVPNVKDTRNAPRSRHPKGPDVEPPRTRDHAWTLARSLARDARRAARGLVLRRNEVAVLASTGLYVLIANRWPWPTFGVTVVGGWALWHFVFAERIRTAWYLRGDTKYDVYINDLFRGAGMNIPPKVKRDSRGRAEVWIGERSWRIELLVPQGSGMSAKSLAAMWPQLKTEVGVGCIRVNLHERTGNHVTLLIVWSRDPGERAVAIDAEALIIVRPTQRFPDLVFNAGLDGWVLRRFAHAREWNGTQPYGVVPTVIDALTAGHDHPDDEPDEVLEVGPGEWDDDPVEVEVDTWDDEPRDEPDPEPTWPESPQVMGPVAGSYSSGGGEGSVATPPLPHATDPGAPTPPLIDPFRAPPSGPIISAGLFAPTVQRPAPATPVPVVAAVEVPEFRPPGAGPGTATGDLWDLIEGGAKRTTRDLADAVRMAQGSAGNALSRWRKMGLVACTDGQWHVAQSGIATVLFDGDEEEAGSGGA